MNNVKGTVELIVTKLAWIPVLLFLIFYALVINVDKVHNEFED